jgi:UDP:flavonoid glycosyltransferase YjiC (YdhE family)
LAPVTGLPDLWSRSTAVLSLPPPSWTKGRMPAEVIPVGPIANEPRFETAPAPDGKRPRVVISLSSSYMHQEVPLERLAEAASGPSGSVIVSLAGAIERDAVRMPDAVEVVDWLNFETVLPFTDLLVTHGGQATVSAGMRHGVPMIFSPLGRDQDRVGRHVEANGIGLVLEDGADVESSRLTMGRVLGDPSFLEASERASTALQALDDGAIAVEILEELAERDGQGATR